MLLLQPLLDTGDPPEHVVQVSLHFGNESKVSLEVPRGALQTSLGQVVAVGEHLVRLLEPLQPEADGCLIYRIRNA